MPARFRVFISLRFCEAMEAGVALKEGLEERSIPAFLCDVTPGGNIADTVVDAIDECELVVILGTRTYGEKTNSRFSSREELEFIINEQKPFFLIKMCERFKHAKTRFFLPPTVSYHLWQPFTQDECLSAPDQLLDAIVDKLDEAALSDSTSDAATHAPCDEKEQEQGELNNKQGPDQQAAPHRVVSAPRSRSGKQLSQAGDMVDPVSTAEKLVSCGAHLHSLAVIKYMQAFPASPAVQIEAFRVLAGQAQSSSAKQQEVWTSGALDPILQAMNQHHSDPAVQQQGCGAMYALLFNRQSLDELNLVDERVDAAHEAGAVRAFVSVLATHEHVASTVEAGLRALWAMVCNPEHSKRLADHDIINLAVTAMRRHEANIQVQEAAAGLLWFMMRVSDMPKVAFQRGATLAILRACAKHKEKPDALWTCFASVVGLALVPEARHMFIQADFVDMFMSIVRSNRESSQTRGHAFLALSSLCRDPSAVNDQTDIVPIALSFLKTAGDLARVKRSACFCVAQLATLREQRQALLASGALELVVTAFRENINSAQLSLVACLALQNLALDSSIKSDVGSKGGVNLILQALRVHTTNEHVQKFACAALCRLAMDATCRRAIVQGGGIPLIISATEAFPNVAAHQSNTCGAFLHIAETPELIQPLLAAGCLGSVLAVLERHPGHAEVQRRALACLTRLRPDQDPSALQTFQEKHGTRLVCQVLGELRNEPAVVACGCRVLLMLARTPALHPSIFMADGTGLLQVIMGKHVCNSSVQQTCCRVLGKLAEHGDSGEALGRQGCGPPVLCAMQAHMGDQNMQAAACAAVSRLAGIQGCRQALLGANGQAHVLRAMEQHHDKETVQAEGCAALEQLCGGEEVSEARACDVLAAVFAAVQQHPRSSRILSRACHTLANIARAPRVVDAVVTERNVKWMLDVLQEHASDVAACQAACRALANLAGAPKGRKQVVASGGVSAVVRCMRQLSEYAQVQQRGAAALANLAADNKDKAGLLRCGFLEVVLDAMRAHKGSAAVQAEGCRALSNLAVNAPAVRQLAAEKHGLALVLEAMRIHPASAWVQWSACLALSNIAHDRSNIRQLLLRCGGIELIFSAVTAHWRNAYVQKCAWAALRDLATQWDFRRPLREAGAIPIARQVKMQYSGDGFIIQQVREFLKDISQSEVGTQR